MQKTPKKYRDTASFGKRQEYIIAGELLKRGFDVYMTLVDDQGIDCILRLDQHRYIDVQIKARSNDAQQWNRFAALSFVPRKNLYFIFYAERTDTCWIMSSVEVDRLGRRNRTGTNAGLLTISFPKNPNGATAKVFSAFTNENGFARLKAYELAHGDEK